MSEYVKTRQSKRESEREQPIMALHQRKPTKENGYTDAVEPTAIYQITCKREGVHIRTFAESKTDSVVDRDLLGRRDKR